MAAHLDVDPELLEACRRGDRAAFRRLYERCGEHVYRLALRFVRCPEDAEDLAQEIFVRLFERIGQYRGESAFATWFYRLAVNFCLTHRRKNRTAAPLEAVAQELATLAPSPAESCVSDELAQRIESAVADLPEGLKTVFFLVTSESCSYRQTAEILNLSVEAVRTRMMRARQELRERLRAYVES